MSRVLWRRLGVGLLALAGAVALYAVIAPRLLPLPVYMRLPDLTLTDQDGRPFALDRTRGEVVVLSPIYTHCPDICPLTTSKLRQVQRRLRDAGLGSRVHLISFTVDPARDRPAVLKRFADGFEADPASWTFLTGTADQVERLTRALGVSATAIGADGTPLPDSALAADSTYLVNHTDRFYVADRRGDVRALTPGSQADVGQVVSIVRRLIARGG